MTTMQPWEKASHWSKTYFSLTTLTYFLLISRKMWLKCCGKLSNLVLFFFITDSGGNAQIISYHCPKKYIFGWGQHSKPLYYHSWLHRICMNCNQKWQCNVLVLTPLQSIQVLHKEILSFFSRGDQHYAILWLNILNKWSTKKESEKSVRTVVGILQYL